MEASLQKLEQADSRYTSELDAALMQYAELTKQAADMDTAELGNARTPLRQDKKQHAIERLKTAYGMQYDYSRMQRAESDVAAMLGEEVAMPSICKQLRELSNKQEPRQRKPKSIEHGQER